LILIATVHGAFLSQQVWGLHVRALAPIHDSVRLHISALFPARMPSGSLTAPRIARVPASLATVSLVAASLLISGWSYTWSHERLSYAKLSEGRSSALPCRNSLVCRFAAPGFRNSNACCASPGMKSPPMTACC